MPECGFYYGKPKTFSELAKELKQMTKAKYDSAPETEAHIERVQTLCEDVVAAILTQSEFHDESKLESPEKETFDEVTPQLKALTYGSQEYKDALGSMGPALAHHYENNRHHPENAYGRTGKAGAAGMTLVDVIEMLCDWKAATERHADGSLAKSLLINPARFDFSAELSSMLVNTALSMGWITQEELDNACA
jgi:hypothetical protein